MKRRRMNKIFTNFARNKHVVDNKLLLLIVKIFGKKRMGLDPFHINPEGNVEGGYYVVTSEFLGKVYVIEEGYL